MKCLLSPARSVYTKEPSSGFCWLYSAVRPFEVGPVVMIEGGVTAVSINFWLDGGGIFSLSFSRSEIQLPFSNDLLDMNLFLGSLSLIILNSRFLGTKIF